MKIEEVPYKGHYPSAARQLIEEGKAWKPQVTYPGTKWAEGLDITYRLRRMGPESFAKYRDTLLLLAYQEMMRYEEYRWKFARFVVSLGITKAGKTLSIPQLLSWNCHMHSDPEVVVYGLHWTGPEGEPVKVKGQVPLEEVSRSILELSKRYPKGLSRQKPYIVLKLVISIRDNT